jgi:hypothetical protein
MYKVKMEHEAYPDGTEFSVNELPVSLVNGKTSSVKKEDVEEYEARTGNKFKDVVAGIAGATLTDDKGGGK